MAHHVGKTHEAYDFRITTEGYRATHRFSSIIGANINELEQRLNGPHTNYVFPDKNLNLTLHTKISDKVRDYGNANQPASGSYEDVKLNSYMVNDLSLNYNLFDTYKVFFDVKNIFDKKYETALQYSQMDRSFTFGIKRKY